LRGLRSIYVKLGQEFDKVLSTAGLRQKKEGMKNKTISFHSFRRFVKSVISDQVSQDYSEWYLGHAGRNVYYQKKEPERREIYATKCMRYLTFLDYTTLENTGRNIELKLEEKEKEINYLLGRDLKHETEMKEMNQKMDKIFSLIQENPKLAKVKREVLTKI
jgi:hypothetical protein